MKAKLIAATLLFSLLVPYGVQAAQPTVEIDGKTVVFPDAQPKITEGRVLVPLRGVFENLGFTINWNQESKTAFLSGSGIRVQVSEEGIFALSKASNLQVPIESDVPPQIWEDRFYIPLRAVAQASGAKVDWDAESKKVIIVSASEQAKQDTPKPAVQTPTPSSPAPSQNTSVPDEDIAIDDPEGTLTANDTAYLESLFSSLDNIKALAKNDPALLCFYGLNNSDKLIPNTEEYPQIQVLCDNILSLTPTSKTEAIQAKAAEFAGLLKQEMTLCKDTSLTPYQLYEKTVELSKKRYNISLAYSSELYNYFTENSIGFERLFGEYVLDAMN
ncbi:MAG: copper amine oxidase N-terminal domain-containing protein [Firmicutes bacterium]|nr:copper amine oxidase N-terminal domain-containing protein [Bacillota bacterium]